MANQLEEPEDIKRYYQRYNVADNYITKRFKQPIHALAHKYQVKIINQTIDRFNAKSLLEIACGPARLTSEIKVKNGISVDSSKEMLDIARKRTKKRWTFKKADAFDLQFKSKFDIVITFRFIFHFKAKKRRLLYEQISRHLKKGGILIFDALNKNKVSSIRKVLGKKRYIVYDKLYTKKELITELDKNGFKLIDLYPIMNHFWIETFISHLFSKLRLNKPATTLIKSLEKIQSRHPYEWVVICRKK